MSTLKPDQEVAVIRRADGAIISLARVSGYLGDNYVTIDVTHGELIPHVFTHDGGPDAQRDPYRIAPLSEWDRQAYLYGYAQRSLENMEHILSQGANVSSDYLHQAIQDCLSAIEDVQERSPRT